MLPHPPLIELADSSTPAKSGRLASEQIVNSVECWFWILLFHFIGQTIKIPYLQKFKIKKTPSSIPSKTPNKTLSSIAVLHCRCASRVPFAPSSGDNENRMPTVRWSALSIERLKLCKLLFIFKVCPNKTNFINKNSKARTFSVSTKVLSQNGF